MSSHRILITALVLLCVAPVPARADRSAEAQVKLCARDGKNLVARSARTAAKFDKLLAKPSMSRLQLKFAQENLDREDDTLGFKARCIDAEGLNTARGHTEVLALYNEASALLEGARKRLGNALQSDTDQAVAHGPGGSAEQTRTRWRSRPDRCHERSASSRQSRVAGVASEGPGPTPLDAVVTRLACGQNIAGIDEVPDGRTTWSDLQDPLAEALTDPQLSADHQTLYRGLLAAACYFTAESQTGSSIVDGPSWDVTKHYPTWALCAQETRGLKSAAEIAKAFARLYPDRRFERENVEYLAAAGMVGRDAIDGPFRKFAASHPRLKQVYWDSRVEAKARHTALRKQYRRIYEALDPMTAQVTPDLSKSLPPTCWNKLASLRAELAKDVSPRNQEDSVALGTGHPFGYQITEAMVLCSVSLGTFARAARDARLLRRGYRQVTAGEAVYYGTKEAEIAVQKTMSKAAIKAQLPGYDWGHNLPNMPHSAARLRGLILEERVHALAGMNYLGQDPKKPAIVGSVKKTRNGATITFKKVTWKVPDHQYSCRTTNRVESYDIRSNRIVPRYAEDCKITKRQWQKVSYQAPSSAVASEDAALVKPGQWAELMINANDPGDGTVVNVFEVQGREKGKQIVFEGIPIR